MSEDPELKNWKNWKTKRRENSLALNDPQQPTANARPTLVRVGGSAVPVPSNGGAHSPKRMLFLDIVLSVFRLSGLLVAEGDAMTEDLGLTSARWKVIGVVALSTAGLTVPGIARVLGQSRQAVQRITDVMAKDGLITYQPNPKHKRSVLVLLTEEGKSAYHALREVQDPWAIRNTEDIPSKS
jgi:DNA-binding MarR family transcriptional regulator